MTESIGSDRAIPKPLRAAIRHRLIVAFQLRDAIREGVTPQVFSLAAQLTDLNRSLYRSEWLARAAGFDPIAMGM